jgi:hypothetical protein
MAAIFCESTEEERRRICGDHYRKLYMGMIRDGSNSNSNDSHVDNSTGFNGGSQSLYCHILIYCGGRNRLEFCVDDLPDVLITAFLNLRGVENLRGYQYVGVWH